MYWNLKIEVRLVVLLLGGWAEHFIGKGNPDDFYTCLNSIFILLQKNVCLEHFIAEWNQCFSRIFLNRFYWAYHFRSSSFKQFEGNLRNFQEC